MASGAVAFLAACLASGCFFGSPVVVHETWTEYQIGSYFGDKTRFGLWNERFTGYGHAAVVLDAAAGNMLELQPRASDRLNVTHSALVTSIARMNDFDATIAVSTVEQLRKPAPNRWETAWTLWHYTNPQHFYFFFFGPQGWELGKEFASHGPAQRFFATGATPKAELGVPNAIRIVQSGSTMFVYVNGMPVTHFTDSDRPYLSGAIGLYSEDARARFGVVHVSRL